MKKLFLVLVLGLSLWGLRVGSAQAADNLEPVYGLNRFQTAVQIAFKINPGTVHNVLLANGYSFADSLAGVPLAKQKKAPLLYVDSSPSTSGDALSYIQNHLAHDGNIYILGGTGVVSDSFVDALVGMGFSVSNIHRLGGATRYETAVAIAKEVSHNGTEFFIASGDNFPDALSGSVLAAVLGDVTSDMASYLSATKVPTYAAQGGVPLLLIPSDGTIPSCVIDYLNNVSLPTWLQKQYFQILGGTGAVPDGAVQKLSTSVNRFDSVINRYYGKDRYETMAAINRAGFETFYAQSGLGNKIPHVYLATGEDFPDALAGAVLAALNHSPLVLINNSLPASSIDLLAHYSSENSQGGSIPTTLTVVGDPSVITQDTVSFVQSVYK
ncbi:MAG: cell wall-binding repeat-containing protein [Desulfitobacteriaceae bacterium]